MTPKHPTGSGGGPWVEYLSPKPPPVLERDEVWGFAPLQISERCAWWLQQLENGWRPPRRVSGLGWDGQAQWFGVYAWEWRNLIRPWTSG